jgi:hypothetical protein
MQTENHFLMPEDTVLLFLYKYKFTLQVAWKRKRIFQSDSADKILSAALERARRKNWHFAGANALSIPVYFHTHTLTARSRLRVLCCVSFVPAGNFATAFPPLQTHQAGGTGF